MAEIDKRKQQYLDARFTTSCGTFADARDLAKDRARTADGSFQSVPGVSSLELCNFHCWMQVNPLFLQDFC